MRRREGMSRQGPGGETVLSSTPRIQGRRRKVLIASILSVIPSTPRSYSREPYKAVSVTSGNSRAWGAEVTSVCPSEVNPTRHAPLTACRRSSLKASLALDWYFQDQTWGLQKFGQYGTSLCLSPERNDIFDSTIPFPLSQSSFPHMNKEAE